MLSLTARLRAAGCVFAEEDAALLLAVEQSAAEIDVMVDRRGASIPLEQVLG